MIAGDGHIYRFYAAAVVLFPDDTAIDTGLYIDRKLAAGGQARPIRGGINHRGVSAVKNGAARLSVVIARRCAAEHIGQGSGRAERSVETDWTPIEAWDKLAETCGRYLHKGRRVRLIGSLHTRSWEDRESGQKRFKTVVKADEILFLDARPEQESESAEVAETEDIPF